MQPDHLSELKFLYNEQLLKALVNKLHRRLLTRDIPDDFLARQIQFKTLFVLYLLLKKYGNTYFECQSNYYLISLQFRCSRKGVLWLQSVSKGF